MNYELIKNSLNDLSRPLETVLLNRGVADWQKYLNLNESCVQSYTDLSNMQEAVECFVKHYDAQHKIIVMADSDVDGYTSSAMLYLYIKSLDEDIFNSFLAKLKYPLTDSTLVGNDISCPFIFTFVPNGLFNEGSIGPNVD